MPAPLSHDLRRRIFDAYRNGQGTLHDIAERFEVGPASITRLVRRYQQTGSLAPKPPRGGPETRVRSEDIAMLEAWLKQNPSLTQCELARRYAEETGRSVSQRSISRRLAQHGITRKKSRSLLPSATEPM